MNMTQGSKTFAQLAEARGRWWVSGDCCACGDAIRASDLVKVDFDVKDICASGGIYLVRSPSGGHGTRRMKREPHGIAIDQSGYGDWATVASAAAIAWEVLGKVDCIQRDEV